MKVLLISHNCISRATNMGKTLYGYFQDFSSEELGQFYLKNETPGRNSLCGSHYRFTDRDALNALLFPRITGRIFGTSAEAPKRDWAVPLYAFGSKRTVMGYALRELLWKRDPWNTEAYWKWVEELAPDVIFFASGDYGFLYRIASQTAQRMNKPLVVCCVDDHYLHNRNSHCLLGRWLHGRFMRTVSDTMDQAAEIYGICEALAQAYGSLFGKKCRVLHTPATVKEGRLLQQRQEIAYLGNLELGRAENLIAIGRALQKLSNGSQYLQVYSADRELALLKQMCPENGIRFHGAIPAEQVVQVMQRSLAVVHTESFLSNFQSITRFSVSAKIPDSLTAGPCIIAYGPEEIASMQYLKTNQAAYCITEPSQLEAGLRAFLEDGELQQKILEHARALGNKNHQMSPLRPWLEALCQKEIP